jgi:iron complex transport system ATP-binding protein
MEVFELVSALVRQEGLGALMVTHHVNLAARFADRITVLDHGRIVATGTPPQALTRDVMERVFEWPVAMTDWRGAPQVVPLRAHE